MEKAGGAVMNDCCLHNETTCENTIDQYPRSHCCPANGKRYSSVKRQTLLHHLFRPWQKSLTEQGYYFCTDPECDVVYFGQDNTVLHTDDLRTTVWQKTNDKKANICYCFGVSKETADADLNNNGDIRSFVLEQTRQSQCSCETHNPSGRCCLKDFPSS
jgi:hypothetical protein